METDKKRYLPARSRGYLASIVSLLLGFGVVIGFFNGWILVVGSHVIRAWILSSGLLLASLVLWVLWTVRGSRRPGPRRNDGRWGQVRSVAFFMLVAVVGAGSAMVAFFDLGTSNFILDPHGPDGCRAVVRETAMFGGSQGEAYAVGIIGVGRSAGKWHTYDVYRPINAGDYTLVWTASGGELTIADAYVFRTRTQSIARHKALQPLIDSGELSIDNLYDPEPFDRKPVNCH
jgi:hypothetical protein